MAWCLDTIEIIDPNRVQVWFRTDHPRHNELEYFAVEFSPTEVKTNIPDHMVGSTELVVTDAAYQIRFKYDEAMREYIKTEHIRRLAQKALSEANKEALAAELLASGEKKKTSDCMPRTTKGHIDRVYELSEITIIVALNSRAYQVRFPVVFLNGLPRIVVDDKPRMPKDPEVLKLLHQALAEPLSLKVYMDVARSALFGAEERLKWLKPRVETYKKAMRILTEAERRYKICYWRIKISKDL